MFWKQKVKVSINFPQSSMKGTSLWTTFLMVMNFLSVCGVFFSNSVLGLWVFLEVKIFTLVPILLKYEHSGEQFEYSQSVMLYYVLNMMGSLFMMMDWMGGWDSWWVFFGVMLKIGLYPTLLPYMIFISRQYSFIFWYLNTVKKIPLLCFMGKFKTGDLTAYSSMMVMSFMVGLWIYTKNLSSGSNNIYLGLAIASVLDKGIVMYLSFFKMSWALAYVCFYSLKLVGLLGVLVGGSNKYLMGLFVFGVSGFPPFLGFYVKILALVSLWSEESFLFFLLGAMFFQGLIYVKILMDVFLQNKKTQKPPQVSWFIYWCVLQMVGSLVLG